MKKEIVKKLNFGNWPLSENILLEIGRMHTLWSYMESALLLHISKLAGYNELSDRRPYAILSNSSFQQKLDMFGALCDILSEKYPHLVEYQNVISLLKTAQKLRNTYTHQSIVYIPEKGEFELAQSKAHGKLKTSVEKIDITDIKRATIAIDEANSAMYELILRKKIKPVYKRILDREKEV